MIQSQTSISKIPSMLPLNKPDAGLAVSKNTKSYPFGVVFDERTPRAGLPTFVATTLFTGVGTAFALSPLTTLVGNVFLMTIVENLKNEPRKQLSPSEILNKSLKGAVEETVQMAGIAAMALSAVLPFLLPSSQNRLIDGCLLLAKALTGATLGVLAYKAYAFTCQTLLEKGSFQAVSDKIDSWTGKEPQRPMEAAKLLNEATTPVEPLVSNKTESLSLHS